MNEWWKTQYPLGTSVMVGVLPGWVSNFFGDGTRPECGIVVSFEAGGYTSIPTCDLPEEGKPGFVRKTGEQ